MAKKRSKLGKLTKKVKSLDHRTVRSVKDLPAMSERSQLNYSMVTSEFQAALLIINGLKPYLDTGSVLHQRLITRSDVLEEESIKELRLVFGIMVSKGTLATTPILDMDDGLRNALDAQYHQSLLNDTPNIAAPMLSSLAAYRRGSSILYPSFAPVHIVLAFIQSDNFYAQFEAYAATQVDGHVPSDDDVTENDLKLMVNTLATLANTPYDKYPELLLTIQDMQQNPDKEQLLNTDLAGLLLGEIDIYKFK